MSTRVVIKRRRGTKGTHPLLVTFKGRGRREGKSPSDGTVTMKPSRGAGTKEEFRELHRDQMRERRARYHADKRGPDKAKSTHTRFGKWFDSSWKQQDVAWRTKSIWPDGKTARPGRMG